MQISPGNKFGLLVCFLGRIVPKGIEAVESLKNTSPKTIGEVRYLVGLLGYYRRYIPNFARSAKPLYDLLNTSHSTRTTNSKSGHLPSSTKIHWTQKQQESSETLIGYLTRPPIMAYPDYTQPYIVHTDASNDGLGAILYQKQDGKMRVIAYASRTLTPAEKNYHAHAGKLEFLALKWAITEQFKDYLYYAPKFTVYTDNNPLTYVLTSAKLNATGLRWIGELADYNFNIRYRPGKANVDADTLSRMSLNMETYMETCTEETTQQVLQATISGIQLQDKAPWISTLTDESGIFPTGQEGKPVKKVADVAKAQQSDPTIQNFLELKKNYSSVPLAVKQKEPTAVQQLLHEWNKLSVKNGLLCRCVGEIEQVVWPTALRHHVFKELHVNMGHLGHERVFDLARTRVYWPRMHSDIKHYVQNVCRCLKQVVYPCHNGSFH